MKRNYNEPTTTVVEIKQQSALLQASMTGINSEEFEWGGAGNGEAHAREYELWEE